MTKLEFFDLLRKHNIKLHKVGSPKSLNGTPIPQMLRDKCDFCPICALFIKMTKARPIYVDNYLARSYAEVIGIDDDLAQEIMHAADGDFRYPNYYFNRMRLEEFVDV